MKLLSFFYFQSLAQHPLSLLVPGVPVLYSSMTIEHSVCNRGVASSSPIIGILTENFSTGTRVSCV